MRLIYENDTTLQNTKKNANQNKTDKLKITIIFLNFLETYVESQNNHYLFTNISYLSSLFYLELASQTLNYTIFGI